MTNILPAEGSVIPFKVRFIVLPALLLLVPARDTGAQATSVRVTGDTVGAPAKCRAAAVASISRWFRSFTAADSAGLAATLAPDFVISTGKNWVPWDAHGQFRTLGSLMAYVRARHARNERLVLREIAFTVSTENRLGFRPYFTRSADDLGTRPLEGLGKAEYRCGRGIVVLNMAPAAGMSPKPGEREPGAPADSIARHLRFLEGVWNSAHIRGDTAALFPLFADDIVVEVPGMAAMRKDDLLRFWRSGRSGIVGYETTLIRVRSAGSVNVVEGLLTRRRNFGERLQEDVWRFRKTYALRGDRWRVVRYVAVAPGGR